MKNDKIVSSLSQLGDFLNQFSPLNQRISMKKKANSLL